jgi:hypothetical protein
MYLQQTDPEKLIILDTADRLAIMAEDNAIRYQAARRALANHLAPDDASAETLIRDEIAGIKFDRMFESAQPISVAEALALTSSQDAAHG